MRPANIVLLAGAAVAWALALPGGSGIVSKAIGGRAVTVTQSDFDNFKFFGQYAAAAFCNTDAAPGAPMSCSNDACPTVMANGARILLSLSGDTSSNVAGYVARDDQRKLIVVAMRGSVSVRNWMTNLRFAFKSCDFVKDCQVHDGFQQAWGEINDQVLATVAAAAKANPSYKIVTTGHSLGAAMATLAGVHIRLAGFAADIYTFGSPRVGNAQFVDFVTAQPGAEYRLTHTDDPVPRLPPMFLGYRHTSPEDWLHGGGPTTVDYGLADVKVCEGIAAMDCINSVVGFSVDAHLYYLRNMPACHARGLQMRDTNDVTDAELKQRLDAWAAMDREYIANLTRSAPES